MFFKDVIRLELPSTSKYLNVLGACIGEMLAHEEGLDDAVSTIYNIQLATHECCANIIDHAYGTSGGRIGVTLALAEQPRRLVVEVRDSGKSFDAENVRTPDLNQPQVRGYGLFLMRQLMDEVTYIPQTGNNCWRLIKNL